MRLIKIIISIIFLGFLAFPLLAQEPIPFAGESVWNTSCIAVPSTRTDVDTLPVRDSLGEATGELRAYERQIDVIDKIDYKVQWIITDKIIQRSTEGIFIWRIESAAIASDGQAASYEIVLESTRDFSKATQRNHGTKSKPAPLPPVRKATLVVLCPQGQFSEILLMEPKSFVSYQ